MLLQQNASVNLPTDRHELDLHRIVTTVAQGLSQRRQHVGSRLPMETQMKYFYLVALTLALAACDVPFIPGI